MLIICGTVLRRRLAEGKNPRSIFYYYRPIYVQVFQEFSFPQVSS